MTPPPKRQTGKEWRTGKAVFVFIDGTICDPAIKTLCLAQKISVRTKMFERIPLLRQSEMFKRVVGNLFADIYWCASWMVTGVNRAIASCVRIPSRGNWPGRKSDKTYEGCLFSQDPLWFRCRNWWPMGWQGTPPGIGWSKFHPPGIFSQLGHGKKYLPGSSLYPLSPLSVCRRSFWPKNAQTLPVHYPLLYHTQLKSQPYAALAPF